MKKTKPIRKIKLLGHEIPLLKSDETDGALGLAVSSPPAIVINKGVLMRSEIEEVMLHEIIHQCLVQSGFSRRLNDATIEEDFVTSLTPVLYAVLKDNYMISEWNFQPYDADKKGKIK